MATNIVGISKTKVLSNLDTYNHTALQASMYTVSLRLTERPTSGVTITIQQNSVTAVATSVPATTQDHVELRIVLNCAINDVISVILASSTAHDQKPNEIKAILQITPGSY